MWIQFQSSFHYAPSNCWSMEMHTWQITNSNKWFHASLNKGPKGHLTSWVRMTTYNFWYENQNPLHILASKSHPMSQIPKHYSRVIAMGRWLYLGIICGFREKWDPVRTICSHFREVNLGFHTQNCGLLLISWLRSRIEGNSYQSFQDHPAPQKFISTQRLSPTKVHQQQRLAISGASDKGIHSQSWRDPTASQTLFPSSTWFDLLYFLVKISCFLCMLKKPLIRIQKSL